MDGASIANDLLNKGEFLLFVVGLIIGLALSRIVGFFGEILAWRRHVTFSLTHLMLMVIAFVIQVHYWWLLMETTDFDHLQFAGYLRMMILPLIMFAATAVLCPKFEKNEPFHIWEYFRDQITVFYLLVIASLIAAALQGHFVWHEPMLVIWIRVATIVFILLFFWIKKAPVQFFLALVLFVVMVGFIFVKTPT